MKYLMEDLKLLKINFRGIFRGRRASYFLVVDKNNFKFFGSAQDHKRVGEKTLAQIQVAWEHISAAMLTKTLKKILKIVKPTLSALKELIKGFYMLG